jgi:hypothetical protein
VSIREKSNAGDTAVGLDQVVRKITLQSVIEATVQKEAEINHGRLFVVTDHGIGIGWACQQADP